MTHKRSATEQERLCAKWAQIAVNDIVELFRKKGIDPDHIDTEALYNVALEGVLNGLKMYDSTRGGLSTHCINVAKDRVFDIARTKAAPDLLLHGGPHRPILPPRRPAGRPHKPRPLAVQLDEEGCKYIEADWAYDARKPRKPQFGAEDVGAIHIAIARLPKNLAYVILGSLDEATDAQLAEELGVTTKTIGRWRQQAFEQLKTDANIQAVGEDYFRSQRVKGVAEPSEGATHDDES